MAVPSFIHWKLNGPVPDAVVLNVAVVPTEFVEFDGPAAVSGTLTVSVALLVADPHAPLTMTRTV
jgi:hypothetical protein